MSWQAIKPQDGATYATPETLLNSTFSFVLFSIIFPYPTGHHGDHSRRAAPAHLRVLPEHGLA